MLQNHRDSRDKSLLLLFFRKEGLAFVLSVRSQTQGRRYYLPNPGELPLPRARRRGPRQGVNVFWFFFSKKNCFLAA